MSIKVPVTLPMIASRQSLYCLNSSLSQFAHDLIKPAGARSASA
jgi:hypothetical protein